MKQLLVLASSMMIFSLSYASTPTTPPTAPTKSSHPLPTMSETNNSDTVQTEKVQATIVKTPALKNQTVSAAYQSGEVILQGSVETKAQEEAAINAAKSVPGVTKVSSELTIKGSADN